MLEIENYFYSFNRIFSKKSNSLQNNLVIYNPGIFPILGYFFDYFRKEYEHKKLRKLQYNNFDFIINYDPLGDYFIDLCSKFYKKSSILFYNTQDFLETPQPNFLKQIRSKSLSKMYNYKNIKIIVSNPNLSKYGKYHLLLFGGVELISFDLDLKI